MSEVEIIELPTRKRKVKIEKSTQRKLLSQAKEEAQVIVHCRYTGRQMGDRIRIWKSTFLCDRNSSHKSKMIHVENIAMYPTWMFIGGGQTVYFTLFFTALPKSCRSFDMIEQIPEFGGFEVENIQRNTSDVYQLVIS
jgi:hypothetical protein